MRSLTHSAMKETRLLLRRAEAHCHICGRAGLLWEKAGMLCAYGHFFQMADHPMGRVHRLGMRMLV